jgi:hypothetical protein
LGGKSEDADEAEDGSYVHGRTPSL